MSKELPANDNDMRDEYDFSNAKPNAVGEYFREAGVRVLDEDLRGSFPDSDTVNQALREWLNLPKNGVRAGVKAA